jgi:hypothetical protein
MSETVNQTMSGAVDATVNPTVEDTTTGPATVVLALLALTHIKGVAQLDEEFAPADHGLAQRDVAELVASGAAQVLETVLLQVPVAAAPGAAAKAEPGAAAAKATKTAKAAK